MCYAKKGQCVAFSRHIRVNIKALCVVCVCLCVCGCVLWVGGYGLISRVVTHAGEFKFRELSTILPEARVVLSNTYLKQQAKRREKKEPKGKERTDR